MPQYCHLHNHTQFSLLDGATEIGAMMRKAKEDGQSAVALTDHGNMFGAFKFVREAHKEGIKPIVGCEFYLVEDRHIKSFSRAQGERDKRYHQLMLAKNEIGYQNLAKLCSLGYVEGLYSGYPRIDKHIIEQYHEGLIATSCCIGAEIPQAIMHGRLEEAEEKLKWWLDLFGEDYYIELQRHAGLENIDGLGISQEDINQHLLTLAKKYDVKVIATNDSHYLDQKDADVHDTMLCINVNKQKEDTKRFKFASDDFFFKTQAEMAERFSDVPQALETTMEIADKVGDLQLENPVALPRFPIPEGFADQQAYLRHLTYMGAQKRYGDLTEVITERIDFELGVIEQSGYPGYFLIVQDITTQARKMGVSVGPGRGSAAGSVVAYCLGITNIDPLEYDLLFERFLNPERVSMPDIDIDFDDVGRSKVLDYVIDKYGRDQVAQIITYGTMAAKLSIRDTGRVMGVPLSDVNRVAKQYPAHAKATLKALLAEDGIPDKLLKDMLPEDQTKAKAIRELSEQQDEIGHMLRTAKELEGTVRNTGVHACGVVITPDAVTNYAPVARASDDDMQVTQFDNNVAEDAGLLKMDFLGLRTLSIIKDALQHVKDRHGIAIDFDEMAMDDPETYKLFQRGQTIGIFQYESIGMRKNLKELKPTRFEDLIAMNALFRPGPMAYIPNFIKRKHGQEEIKYDLDAMQEILEETYGITVYQEQVMRLSQKLANFSKGEADMLRKAMGKKKRALIDEMYPKFIEGCLSNGHPKEIVDKVWSDWEAFASYAFNKSHSTCYAALAYQTAYLKANYPAEFMASLLTNNKQDTTKLNVFLRECRSMGLTVKPPSVNTSQLGFTVDESGDVVIGLGGLKGVGDGPVEALIEERANGEYGSLVDITMRVNLRAVNKRCIEALVKAGAMDALGAHRAQYFAPSGGYDTYIDHALKFGQAYQKQKDEAQNSLFGALDDSTITKPKPPAVAEMSSRDALEAEKEIIGIYVNGHPLDAFQMEMDNFVNCDLSQMGDINVAGVKVSVAGIVTNSRFFTNDRGEGSCRFALQDFTGSHEFALYRETFERSKDLIVDGQVLFVDGLFKKRYNGDSVYFQVGQVRLLSSIGEEKTKGLTVYVDLEQVDGTWVDQFHQLMVAHPGSHELQVRIASLPDEIELGFKTQQTRIQVNNTLVKALENANIRFKVNA